MIFSRRIVRSALICSAAALALYASGPLPVAAQNAAAMEIRMQELEREIQRLNGVIEEQSFEINSLKARLEKALSDLTLRVRALEGGGSVSSGGAASTNSGYDPYTSGSSSMGSTSVVEPAPRTPNSSFNYVPPETTANDQAGGPMDSVSSPQSMSLPADTPLVAYESAFGLLKKSDFKGAEVQFAAFLKKFPDSHLVPNAKYWYGETFYVRGDYEKSARVFAEAYQDNPKGPKAADNLLKLGLSLAGQKKKDDACIALKKLEEDFSNTAGPIIRRAKQEMNTLGC
ncbi:MAG: tol-pal system protein YbgF [Alphaproteobacteria bacterium]|nr:tol-pal system protein YbgF [Alphaproteobacteria bacterium]MCB9975742.1 tol-pal system protein YbgF [Rhodospirillales bacterium]